MIEGAYASSIELRWRGSQKTVETPEEGRFSTAPGRVDGRRMPGESSQDEKCACRRRHAKHTLSKKRRNTNNGNLRCDYHPEALTSADCALIDELLRQ